MFRVHLSELSYGCGLNSDIRALFIVPTLIKLFFKIQGCYYFKRFINDMKKMCMF